MHPSLSAFLRSRGAAVRLSAPLLLALVFGVGCTDLAVDGDPQLVCAGNADCPNGFLCSDALGLCVDEATVAAAPIAISGDPVVSRSRLSLVDGFNTTTVDVAFDKAAGLGVSALADARFPIPCTLADDQRSASCTLDLPAIATIADDEGINFVDGAFDIAVTAVDAAGNEARARVLLTIDTTAPTVAPGAEVLLLEPLPGNLLREVTSLGALGRAVVQVALTEIPASPPAAFVGDDEAVSLTFDAARSAGQLAVYTLSDVVGAGLADGNHPITIRAVDDVGNASVTRLDTLLPVDTTPPAALATVDDSLVTYVRRFWGIRGEPAPHFAIVGLAGAVEGGATVIVTAADDAASALLGDGIADEDGALDITLNAIDLARVFVRAIDGAGNVGPGSVTQNVTWTASFGGKVRGETRFNPHALFTAAAFDDQALSPNLTAEAARADNLINGDGVDVSAQAVVQELRTGTSGVPNRVGARGVFNPVEGEALVFGGGASAVFPRPQTFLRRGEFWSEVVSGATPTGFAIGLVFDAGRGAPFLLTDDGNAWLFNDGWRQLPMTFPGTARGALGYDPISDRLVLYVTSTTATGETWVLEGDEWELLDGVVGPPVRGGILNFDGVSGRIILATGQDTSLGAPSSAIWSFDDDSWTEVVADTGTRLSAARGVEDLSTGEIHYVGAMGEEGRSTTGFTWTGSALETTSVTPARRNLPAGFYDGRTNTVVVVGGADEDGLSNFTGGTTTIALYDAGTDTWSLEAATPSVPRFRSSTTGVALDRTRAQMVFVGGSPGNTTTLSTEAWDNLSATTVNFPVGTPQSTAARTGAMAFDGVDLRLFTSVGSRRLLDVGPGTIQWSEPALVLPQRAAAAFHEGLNGAVLFAGTVDGTVSDATLLIQGETITTLPTVNNPPPRSSAKMVYDRRLDRLVMTSGFNSDGTLTDVWALEGNTWTQLASLPEGNRGGNLFYDHGRGRVMFFEARGLFELRGSVFEAFPFPAATLNGPLAFYDEISGDITIMGGDINSGPQSTILRYDPAGARPAEVAIFDLEVRGASPTSLLNSLQLRLEAKGTGFVLDGTNTVVAHDLEVLLWTGTSWTSLSLDDTTVDDDGTLQGSINIDPTLLAPGASAVPVAFVAPRQGAMGDDGTPGSISVTVCELEVAYREP